MKRHLSKENKTVKETKHALKIETEQVTLEIPKKLLALLKDRKKDVEEYLQYCAVDTVAADIDTEVFGNPDQIKSEYDLKAEFEAYTGH